MSETLTTLALEYPDTSQMILEDHEPLDSFINEKQQRLLTAVFYSGAKLPSQKPFPRRCQRRFIRHQKPKQVSPPDALLSLGIHAYDDWWQRKVRSYLFWEFGKPPDIVIEVISPTPGNELGSKLTDYEDLRIAYYAVYDPLKQLGENTLQVFELRGRSYVAKTDSQFADCNIGLTLWEGTFEDINATWLRWCYPDGKVIPTGDELAAIKDGQIRQALLLAIKLGLQIKFPGESEALLSEIEGINEVSLLEAIASQITTINSVEDLRGIYSS